MLTLDFTINDENFLILFGVYLTFFLVVYGVAHAIAVFKDHWKKS